MIDCSHFFALHFSHSHPHISLHFTCSIFIQPRRAFLMCRRGPINVKKPQTKWQLQNANCTFCSFTFSHFFCVCALHAVVFTIVCDMELFIGIVICDECTENGMDDDAIHKKMDTFANLMFVENIKQLTASI